MTEKLSSAATIKTYFAPGEKATEFIKEFKTLSDEGKVQLTQGIVDGTLNY
jgi:hypothetical protein